MRRAFHSVQAPKGFAVTIIDNEHFLTVKLDERQFVRLWLMMTRSKPCNMLLMHWKKGAIRDGRPARLC
jgi:hypothetical protein